MELQLRACRGCLGGYLPLPCGTKEKLRVWVLGGLQDQRISPRAPFGMGEQGPSDSSQPLLLPGGGEGVFEQMLG